MKKLYFAAAAMLGLGLIPASTLQSEIYYPWRSVYIGALHGPAWSGLVFAPHKDSLFAVRLAAEKEGKVADQYDLFYLVSEVGPHSPDGQYARVKFDLSLPFKQEKDTPILIKPSRKKDTLTLEWARLEEKALIGRIRGPRWAKLRLIHYFPWESKRGRFRQLPDGSIQGEVREGKAAQYLLWTDRRGEPLAAESDGEELTTVFAMDDRQDLYFVAGVGDEAKALASHLGRYESRKVIDRYLEDEAQRYQDKRVKVSGLNEGVAEAVTNNLFWMMLYQPDHHRLYSPAGRRWIFPKPDGSYDNWTIFEWDSFFNALEASVESEAYANSIVRAVLETQYPNGNIPNWRAQTGGTPDRSQPPVGSFVILKLFERFGKQDLLRTSYPALKKWHGFWKSKRPNGQARRDGNGDGLLEWGSDKDLLSDKVPSWEENASGAQRAKWESGQDDLPNWDDVPFSEESGTLTMNCLDLNCLYALDSWCLAQMAGILNLRQDHEAFLSEYERTRALVNRLLWNEREQFYFDRHWDGRFSTRKAASNFYPLLARIPDEKRALQMLKHLLNSKEFWGEYVLPTISRDDPAFKDQQYWRGTIWPPTNYLVYQGLKAYSFDTVASEFARKSAAMFLRTSQNFQLCPENFDSRTGEAGGQRHQSWGPLFALTGLEEYLDFTPWEGFRFGMIKPERKGLLSRLAVQGRHYDVRIAPSKIVLKEEGRTIMVIDGGAVVRHFLYSESEVSFDIVSLEPRELEIRFLKRGKYQYLLDDQVKKVFEGQSFELAVPDGKHTILILLLDVAD
ncbi:MAG: hypothetical protein A2Y56_07500 [Candidatus Aminicenantes bacterium RBG_13_63_10]|nr:MAG: hypothetical protein A2Y56_07500 [Candidatus Aminicenantes bacterium RBG_13_63_10]